MLISLLGPERAEFYMSLIDKQELFIEKTAHELLWGYTGPLFKLLVLLGLTDDDALMKIEVNAITYIQQFVVKQVSGFLKYQYVIYDAFVIIIMCPYASVIINTE